MTTEPLIFNPIELNNLEQSNSQSHNSKSEQYTLKDALKMVGDQNLYQIRTFIILVLVVMLNCFSLISPTYQFIQPPLLCDGFPCEQNSQNCSRYHHIVPDPSYKFYNIVVEFDLFCDRTIYISIFQSISFLGSLIGSIYFSFLGDQHGRRIAWFACWSVTTIGTIGLATSFNLPQLIISNFIVGLGLIPCYVLGFVIMNEICGDQFRQVLSVSLLVLVFLALFEIILAAIYYASTNWRITYIFTVTVPAIIVLILGIFLYETPKYYVAQRKPEKAIEVLDKIAMINRKPKFSEFAKQNPELLNEELSQNHQIFVEKPKKKFYSQFDLFRYKSLRSATFGFMGISFAMHLIFYGSEYSIDAIATGNLVFILGATMGTAELIGFILINIFIHKVRRKATNFLGFGVSITACFCFCFSFFGISAQSVITDCDFCTKQILIIILCCIIRIFNSFGFALLAVYPNEFYPTCVRSLGNGFVFTLGILGSFMAPYFVTLGKTININPYICIGIASLVGPLGAIFIKETLGIELYDDIQENRGFIDNKE